MTRPETRLLASVALLVASGQFALAQPGVDVGVDDPPPDLRVKGPPVIAPTRLMMRPQPAAPPVAGPAIAAGADTVATDASIDTGYKPLPSDFRDIEERVIFKVNVGYGLDSGPTSGDPLRSGFNPADEGVLDPDGNPLNEQRQYILGDAILGTRGVLMPSLHTYFLSQYSIAADGASRFASLNNVYDERDGRALLVHAGYAEINDLDDPESLLGKVFVRAGRQFRYGTAQFITNFDGITAGYDSSGFEVSGFFGRRVSLFFGDDPGLLGGAGVKLRLKDLANIPIDLAVDYLFFDGGGPADDDIDIGDAELARQYVELSARGKFSGWRTYFRARLADNGDLRVDENGDPEGMQLARLGLELRKAVGRNFVVVGDVEHRFEGEAAYDFLNPAANDVLDIAERLGIGIDPQEATRLSLRASYMMSRLTELYGFVRANLASGVETSGFNRSWQELGAALSHRFARKLWATAQYKLRLTDLDDEANAPGEEFTDTSGTGVTQFHEVAGDARYSLGYRNMTVGAGAYYRVYNVQSPYAEVTNDGRGGARFDVDRWFSKYVRVKLAGELAQPSPAFAPELGTLFSFRAILEAIF
jgi:hypothetical protein